MLCASGRLDLNVLRAGRDMKPRIWNSMVIVMDENGEERGVGRIAVETRIEAAWARKS